MLCFGLTVGLGGCRHKAQVAPLPPVLSPVALEEIPEPENLPMVEAQPSEAAAGAGCVQRREAEAGEEEAGGEGDACA